MRKLNEDQAPSEQVQEFLREAKDYEVSALKKKFPSFIKV